MKDRHAVKIPFSAKRFVRVRFQWWIGGLLECTDRRDPISYLQKGSAILTTSSTRYWKPYSTLGVSPSISSQSVPHPFHFVVRTNCPVIEITQNINGWFTWSQEAQGNFGLIGMIVYTINNTEGRVWFTVADRMVYLKELVLFQTHCWLQPLPPEPSVSVTWCTYVKVPTGCWRCNWRSVYLEKRLLTRVGVSCYWYVIILIYKKRRLRRLTECGNFEKFSARSKTDRYPFACYHSNPGFFSFKPILVISAAGLPKNRGRKCDLVNIRANANARTHLAASWPGDVGRVNICRGVLHHAPFSNQAQIQTGFVVVPSKTWSEVPITSTVIVTGWDGLGTAGLTVTVWVKPTNGRKIKSKNLLITNRFIY